ncbi:MAG: hypothetical protein AVDCRST_MAG49-4307 [uncultured Thermomicrobiales bacterium]|uniref:Uncharacterized protein n=1 Tax=uncultured Thermomicrobiales bacterium TaxID=1645740 RepID=A0A6J4VGW6_9BACT|nr:MAG: hypothetical protein AVDCRST_MAG49-4307 [uncultured Thermomicrobiales bacterium]
MEATTSHAGIDGVKETDPLYGSDAQTSTAEPPILAAVAPRRSEGPSAPPRRGASRSLATGSTPAARPGRGRARRAAWEVREGSPVAILPPQAARTAATPAPYRPW